MTKSQFLLTRNKYQADAAERTLIGIRKIQVLTHKLLKSVEVVADNQTAGNRPEWTVAALNKRFVSQVRRLRADVDFAMQGAPNFLMEGDLSAGSRGGIAQICEWVGALELLLDVGYLSPPDVDPAARRGVLLRAREQSIATAAYYVNENARLACVLLNAWHTKLMPEKASVEIVYILSAIQTSEKQLSKLMTLTDITTSLIETDSFMDLDRPAVMINMIHGTAHSAMMAIIGTKSARWAAERHDLLDALSAMCASVGSIDAMLDPVATCNRKVDVAFHLVWAAKRLIETVDGLLEYSVSVPPLACSRVQPPVADQYATLRHRLAD